MANPKITKDEIEAEINAHKILLRDTDYQSWKAFEGVPSESWEAIKLEREAHRQAIRDLETQLENLPMSDAL